MKNPTILYEYMIQNDEFLVREHEVKVKEASTRKNATIFVFKPKKGNRRFVSDADLEVAHSDRVYSFENNTEKYRMILQDYYFQKIRRAQVELEKNKAKLRILENAKAF